MEDEWESVTYLRKKAPKKSELKTQKAVTEAHRKGEDVETSKKFAAGSNKQRLASKDTAKLDRETEELHHETVELDMARLIQKLRLEKKLTQKDLAQRINEKPQIVVDYESGKAIPNNQILAKMERALGSKLRGKDKGKALTSKK